MFDLSGKKALVTGSTQGIGFALAKALADRGATVYINGVAGEAKIKAAVDEGPGSCPAHCDLAQADCAERLYTVTGDLDILILNASVQFRAPWGEVTDAQMDEQFAVNLKASVKLIQKYAPGMIAKKWGRIVTIGSVQQEVPHVDMPVYSALKSAQVNLVRNLAKQFAPHGVTVNNVAPGVIRTPRNMAALSDKAYEKQVLSKIPCGYAGAAEDCAGVVLLLCSEEGRYMTGENIFTDGGMKL